MGLDNFFKLFVPKDAVFFPLFDQDVENLVKIAETFNTLMNTNDASVRVELIKKIKEYENAGDEITHQIYNLLNKAFITPFDREDIQRLASTIDDVADFINSSADRVLRYRPDAYIPEYPKIAGLLVTAAKHIEFAVKNLKNNKNFEKIKEVCIKINSIENYADDLYHSALSDLFEKEKNATELIKKKEILESMERAVDHAEDVSDVIKTIIIKSA
jgi:uncharacterized protein